MADLGLANPPVYQYIWKDSGLPRYKALVMTVTNREGIVGFAFFALLLSFTGSRIWILIREFVVRKSRPFRLRSQPPGSTTATTTYRIADEATDTTPDEEVDGAADGTTDGTHLETDGTYEMIDGVIPTTNNRTSRTTNDDPAALEELSQGDALWAICGFRNRQHNQTMTTIPKLLSCVALFNIIASFLFGIIVPLYLTGNLGPTVVQAQSTDSCIGLEDRPASRRYSAQLADSYFKQCLGNLDACPKDSQLVGPIPNFSETNATCPFPGDVCLPEVQPVMMQFLGLTPRDYGVNLDNRVFIDHRIICAPLKTEPFMIQVESRDNGRVPSNPPIIWFGRKFHDRTFNGGNETIYGMVLATQNGPNTLSEEYSGNLLLTSPTSEPAYDLHLYPNENESNISSTIHPSLRRDDGEVFIVLFRAGRSYYKQQIDDPVFAAHNVLSQSYIPDREATAIGCVEQFRLCFQGQEPLCTGWRGRRVALDLYYSIVLNIKNSDEVVRLDLLFIYMFFTDFATVREYLFSRSGVEALLSSSFRINGVVQECHPTRQWVLEMETWFTNAFLNARYGLLQIVRRQGPDRTPDVPQAFKLCGIILYQNNAYKNVDFIGLVVSTCALLLICAFSYKSEVISSFRSFVKICLRGCTSLGSALWSAGLRAVDACSHIWDNLASCTREWGIRLRPIPTEDIVWNLKQFTNSCLEVWGDLLHNISGSGPSMHEMYNRSMAVLNSFGSFFSVEIARRRFNLRPTSAANEIDLGIR